MILPDVNVLIYAFSEESVDHGIYKKWLTDLISGDEVFGLSDLVLSSFLRIVTNPRIMKNYASLEEALQFIQKLRSPLHYIPINPGSNHWSIFIKLCEDFKVKGNDISDAYLAAIAIESGSEWISTDHGFSRFPNLRWRHPLK